MNANLDAENQVLFKRYFGSHRAVSVRNEIVDHNQILVVPIAKRYAYRYKIPYDDAFQEGRIGLVSAVENFNPRRKCKFSTHATNLIIKAIRRECPNQGSSRSYRLPTEINDALSSMYTAEEELIFENIELTDANVAQRMLENALRRSRKCKSIRSFAEREQRIRKKMTPLFVLRLRNILSENAAMSLDYDAENAKGDRIRFNNIIASDAPDPEREAIISERNDELDLMMGELTDKERDAIKRSFDIKPFDRDQKIISSAKIRALEKLRIKASRHPLLVDD